MDTFWMYRLIWGKQIKNCLSNDACHFEEGCTDAGICNDSFLLPRCPLGLWSKAKKDRAAVNVCKLQNIKSVQSLARPPRRVAGRGLRCVS